MAEDITRTPAPFERAPDAWETLEEDSGATSTSVSGRATLVPGQYTVWEHQAGGRNSVLYVSVSTEERRGIDFFAMAAAAFGVYQRREEPEYYEDMVATATTEATLTNEVDGNIHRLVFDNTAVFGSLPDGEVSFEFEATVRYEN